MSRKRSPPHFLLLFVAWVIGGVAPAEQYDVYLLAGQSNMDGRGSAQELDDTGRRPLEEAIIYYRNVPHSTEGWQRLAPGYSYPPGYTGGLPSHKFGPELGFAREMLKTRPDQKLALIKGSKGGSNLRVDWKPGEQGKPDSQGQRYRDFIETIRLATDTLEQRGDRYTIRGLLWHQGESDARSSTKVYQKRLIKFIERFREDTGVADLPVIVGEVFDNGNRDSVRVAQRAVGTKQPHCGFVSAEDLTTWDEGTHFDAASQLMLGERFAEAMQHVQAGNGRE